MKWRKAVIYGTPFNIRALTVGEAADLLASKNERDWQRIVAACTRGWTLTRMRDELDLGVFRELQREILAFSGLGKGRSERKEETDGAEQISELRGLLAISLKWSWRDIESCPMNIALQYAEFLAIHPPSDFLVASYLGVKPNRRKRGDDSAMLKTLMRHPGIGSMSPQDLPEEVQKTLRDAAARKVREKYGK